MEPRYQRNIPALTEAECALLRRKRVLVVGCGGLGGHLIEQLARLGIGAIRAVDGDVFEASNLNRQLLCQVPNLGRSKAKAAAERIRCVNPEVAVEAVDSFLTMDNVGGLIHACDAVLDGLDNIESRRILAKSCQEAGIPYVYGAVNGWVAQAAVSMPGDQLVEALYPEGAELKNKSVLSFTPGLCASLQVSLCIKLLLGYPVESGTLFYFDLQNLEFETISLGL